MKLDFVHHNQFANVVHLETNMLTTITAGPFTVRGVSVGGVYTALQVPELHIGLDIGLALRSLAGVDRVFLSHGHADHAGSLATLLGLRALTKRTRPLLLYLPAEIEPDVRQILLCIEKLQRFPAKVTTIAMEPGHIQPLSSNLFVRAFRTFHPVPSLGYIFFRRIQKLRPEYHHLDGSEIARKRQAGDDLFFLQERLELAYATDTLARILHHEKSLLETRVLILECTFLDERKSLADTHAGCHIHLDEIVEMAEEFKNEALVLMHFSQIYHPKEIQPILHTRCPPSLYNRVIPFVPKSGHWPG